jgi:tetratricopeptide (TPR) repeat protein
MATQPELASDALQACLEIASGGDTASAATVAAKALQHGTAPRDLASRAESLVAKALDPNASLELLQEASRLREFQGRLNQAVELAQQAQQRAPQDPALNNNLAWYLGAYQRRTEPALQLIDRAISVAGPLRPLLDTKGVLLLQSGRAHQAVLLLETASLDPDASAGTYLHLAAAYAAAERPAEARGALQAAGKDGPSGQPPFDRQLRESLRSALARSAD